jgi:hypothetical protein
MTTHSNFHFVFDCAHCCKVFICILEKMCVMGLSLRQVPARKDAVYSFQVSHLCMHARPCAYDHAALSNVSMSERPVECLPLSLPTLELFLGRRQVRAKRAQGWGKWSDPSAVLRATSTGGAQYAASSLDDGSVPEGTYSPINASRLAGDTCAPTRNETSDTSCFCAPIRYETTDTRLC